MGVETNGNVSKCIIILTIIIILVYIFHLSAVRVSQEIQENKDAVTFIAIDKKYTTKQPKFQRNNQLPKIYLPNVYPIVENCIHYLRLNESKFSITNAISVLSAYRNHVPNKIYMHTSNSSFSGPFWKKIQETKGLSLILEVIPLNISNYLTDEDKRMNQTLIYNFLKLHILEVYGGIMLDKDMFIVKNLDIYLQHEITLHLEEEVSDQIIIAKKSSYILKMMIRDYRERALNGTNSPFQYIQSVPHWKEEQIRGLVFVDYSEFVISKSMLHVIYHMDSWHWQGRYVVWLMEDLTKQHEKHNVEAYEREFSKNKKFKTSEDDENEDEMSELFYYNNFKDCMFLQMIHDVYY